MRRAKLGLVQELEEPHINLMPLIDVVFVVLVMFIIIAPLLEIDRIQLASSTQESQKEKTSAQDASPITIHVEANDRIYFNKHHVNEKELADCLKHAKQIHPQETPQLLHDKQAHFGTYQIVKNAVESAGFQQLDIILQPGT